MKNFIRQHWLGELPLAMSYWLVGVFLSIPILLSLNALSAYLDLITPSLTYTVWVLLIYAVILLAYQSWVTVGIWRSAENYKKLKHPKVWGRLAQFMVVISTFQVITTLSRDLIPPIYSMREMLIGQDKFGSINIQVIDQGRTLKIDGAFGNGSYSKFEKFINENQSVRRVFLESNGGRLKEAENVTKLIKAKKLETYVEGRCLSFCTLIFLAGNPRFASPMARIGFHSPKFAGSDNSVANTSGIEDSMALYRSFNLPPEFLDKIFSTPFESMWYPTYEELVSAGVVNKLSLGGESATNIFSSIDNKDDFVKYFKTIPLYQKLDNKFPGSVATLAEQLIPLIEAGKKDSEILNVARAYMWTYETKIIAYSNPAIRAAFADLGLAQSHEVSKYGAEACLAFVNAKIDISKVMPSALVKRELALIEEGLDSAYVPSGYNEESYNLVASKLLISMTEGEVNALSNPIKENSNNLCSALTKFYEGIVNLEPDEKDLVVFGMFSK